MNRVAVTKALAGAISASLLAKLADDVKEGALAEKLRAYKLEAEATGARGVELDVLVHRRLLEDWAREIAELGNQADQMVELRDVSSTARR